MPDILVDHVWISGKLHGSVVADELAGAEDLEGKAVQELSSIDHPWGRLELKSSLGLEVVGEVVDLWNG